MALVPKQTRKGDSICVLFGCDVPVVLRKHDDGLWEFIGETYVHGIMDGAAMTRPYDVVEFNLK
jgi:hypothetical protein